MIERSSRRRLRRSATISPGRSVDASCSRTGDVGALYGTEYTIVAGTGRADATSKLATRTRSELAPSVVPDKVFLERIAKEECGFGGQIAIRAEVAAGQAIRGR